MKKIIYVLTSLAHKRVFESFVLREDMDQLIVGPHPNITTSIVPEDYSDFKIKNIKYFSTYKDIQKIVDKFVPDIYVQSDVNPNHNNIKKPVGCKRAFVHHGTAGNHVMSMYKKLGSNLGVWKGFDVYFGIGELFAQAIMKFSGCNRDQIILDALPQLDIIYHKLYYESYRDKVLEQTSNPNPDKVIFFAGFCCKDRVDFNHHNEDYFKTVLELEKIAIKNNWLIMVKPRHYLNTMMKFLRGHKWGKKYIKPYLNIQNSKHLHFITTTGHIYRYFFADLMICNGCSTLEIESCVANKPLVVVRTHKSLKDYDPYETVSRGAGVLVDNLTNLEKSINNSIANPPTIAQRKLVKDLEITLDGQMHKRVQDKLARM